MYGWHTTGTHVNGGKLLIVTFWYPREWWKTVDCDVDQVRDFLNRMISLRRYPAADDSSALTDAGIVSKKLQTNNIDFCCR